MVPSPVVGRTNRHHSIDATLPRCVTSQASSHHAIAHLCIAATWSSSRTYAQQKHERIRRERRPTIPDDDCDAAIASVRSTSTHGATVDTSIVFSPTSTTCFNLSTRFPFDYSKHGQETLKNSFAVLLTQKLPLTTPQNQYRIYTYTRWTSLSQSHLAVCMGTSSRKSHWLESSPPRMYSKRTVAGYANHPSLCDPVGSRRRYDERIDYCYLPNVVSNPPLAFPDRSLYHGLQPCRSSMHAPSSHPRRQCRTIIIASPFPHLHKHCIRQCKCFAPVGTTQGPYHPPHTLHDHLRIDAAALTETVFSIFHESCFSRATCVALRCPDSRTVARALSRLTRT